MNETRPLVQAPPEEAGEGKPPATGLDQLYHTPLFQIPRSTSNLLRPDIERFLEYSRIFYNAEWYTNNGPVARMLERRLAEFHQVEHCLVFSSGFWAIALAMKHLARDGRDEVIMPSLTYRRMADIAAWVPLKPHYCEVDPTTLAMTPDAVEASITDRTALILGVHPIVNCADAAALEAVAEKHGIPILFDSVESVFETSGNARVGGFGAAECFSLHACKLINGFGGGYLTSNDADLVRTLASQRNFGFTGPDEIGTPGGLNAKLNEIHAAMALASLDGLKDQVALNRVRYEAYATLLADLDGIDLVAFDENQTPGYKNIVAKVTEAWPYTCAETIERLNAENILARAYYAPPLHLKSAHIPHVAHGLTGTETLAEMYMNLPCGQRVSVADIEEIVGFLRSLKDSADQAHGHPEATP